jgi:phosphoribosyl 1,2-cyclic phosphodiesterase
MARVRIVVLGSGSAGNCTALVCGEFIVLVDCGFSPRETRRRLALAGLDYTRVRAVVLTHADGDHLHGGWARVLGGLAGPLLHVARRHAQAVRYSGVQSSALVEHDDSFHVQDLSFCAVRMPHDSHGSCAFRIECQEVRIGYATDVGRPTPELIEHLCGCTVVCLESNYCPHMQQSSGRPAYLIDRIMGGRGHLSNHQALEVAQALDRSHPLERLILLHLSRQCNAPEVVHQLYASSAPSLRERLLVTVQHQPAEPVDALPGGHAVSLF